MKMSFLFLKVNHLLYAEAMSSSDAPFWKEVVDSKMNSVLKNYCGCLTNLPRVLKTLGCWWIFEKILPHDRSVKFTTNLVSKRVYTKGEIDLFDTYSAIARITKFMTLLALILIYKLYIYQMDI